ncbi:MAG: hypothetical protein KF760_14060 [Candidatus Eremiobacteraeota bacterium]|nr:hypothetical protein [Candidatus Eremiobacteraeota bacterium]
MAYFLKSFRQLLSGGQAAAQVPVMATSQHLRRFVLVLLALLSLGATFDWSEDARWELRSQDQTLYRLDETMAELGAPPTEQEMFVMDKIGLLVRQRNQRAVNLTVLNGSWEVLRNGQVMGRVNQPLTEWQAQLGDPLTVFINPQKVGVIYYYRGSLIDMGLMVAEDKVLSVMFVEPGYLRGALERSGYTPKQ